MSIAPYGKEFDIHTIGRQGIHLPFRPIPVYAYPTLHGAVSELRLERYKHYSYRTEQ